MFRKNYLIGFLTIALFLIGSTAAFAQTTAAVRGKVELTKADGTKEGVAGALVEVFRIDVKSSFPSAKTDKKGYFNFAGLPLGSQLVLAISAPGIKPVIQGGIKAGMENILVPVEAGDGKRYTEQEVRDAIAGGSTSTQQSAELTAEQKKQKEEYDKKVAEFNEKKKKIESQTATVQKALDEGIAANAAKNYDVAIAKFDEGFQANPDFVGSAPVLLNAKAQALRLRAVSVFNADGSNKDINVKTAALAKVQKDLADSLDTYNQSFMLIKNAPAADINDPKTHELNKLKALDGAKETLRIISITRQVDTTKVDIAKAMIAEYLTVETDQAKKTEAQRYLGDLYLGAGDSENAITEYKKVLEMNANDADALAGIGLSLVTMAYTTMQGDPEKNITADPAKSKVQFQEAANYLQKFIDVAPADHKLLESVKASMDDLKNTQNVAPQKGKTTTTTKKKN